MMIILGGGAAGYFSAIAAAETGASPVLLLERTGHLLAKVKISGGGRCNVTHACYDPGLLVTYYPRGAAALRGPFSRFQPQDTLDWFEQRGVALKTEDDGRIFPVSNHSQTIIDCLQDQARKTRVEVRTNVQVQSIEWKAAAKKFHLRLASEEILEANRVILATGSSPLGWQWAKTLGHTVSSSVPSLFTFMVKDPRLDGLSGVAVANAKIKIEGTPLEQHGPLLVTHWGFSGPAALKLSAWGARVLHEMNYSAALHVTWLPTIPPSELRTQLERLRAVNLHRYAPGDFSFGLPRRLWVRLAAHAGITASAKWTEVSNERLDALVRELTDGVYRMNGKSPFKEEFVTCGGVTLDEVDFRTMESKRCPGLYFAGEILDIDGLTGGFNFQNAWTTGWIAGTSAAKSSPSA